MAPLSTFPAVPIALLLFGSVAILLLTLPAKDIQESPGFMYGIVIDAGSSHTALYIYKWPVDKLNGTGVVTQHSDCHVKGGGISSYAGQRDKAGRSLERCMEQAMEDIPRDKHQHTPVYLGATAGMRLLHMSNPAQSSQILKEVGDKIRSYPFSYRGATILSGQEEGAYGWVTVNYLLENFIKYSFMGRWFDTGRPTLGALDFGGASTQITFATEENVEDEKDTMKLQLYGRTFSLYTHSFLCYGQDQVLKRLMAHVVKAQDFSATVTHPCYPAGHRVTVKLGTILSSPCTAHLAPNPFDPKASVTMEGTGNYEHCVANVSQMFSFDGCPFSRCSFDKVFQPQITGSFMAFSAFFYIHSFLQRVTGISVSTPTQMDEAARKVCWMSFNQLLLLAPDQESRLQDYCASSVFVKVLLLRGYGFDETSFSSISFQRKAGDTSVGWALGYMLSLSSLIQTEGVTLRKALTAKAWGVLLFLFILLLTASVGYIFLRARRERRKSINSESPI